MDENFFYNEKIKKILKKNHSLYQGEYIYHYTNAQGLLGIIENNEIWFSERCYLNDVKEEDFVNDITWNIIKDQQEKKDNTIKQPDISKKQFVFSTSKEEDLIHQWSYYGNGDAYCIKLNRQKMINILYNETHKEYEQLYYGSVFYLKETKGKDETLPSKDKTNVFTNTEVIKKSIKECLEANTNTDEYQKVYEYFCSMIKQYGHNCEDEYRFVIQLPDDDERKIFFRVKKGLFVPYIKLKFENQLPIEGIRIGPGNNEKKAKESVKWILELNGYQNIQPTYSELKIR